MDGLSILHMKESDIFSLIPGKIGAARRLCVLIDRLRQCDVQKPKNITHVKGYSIYEYDQNSSGLKTIEIQPTGEQSLTPQSELQGGLNIIEVPEPSGQYEGLKIVEVEESQETENVAIPVLVSRNNVN